MQLHAASEHLHLQSVHGACWHVDAIVSLAQALKQRPRAADHQRLCYILQEISFDGYVGKQVAPRTDLNVRELFCDPAAAVRLPLRLEATALAASQASDGCM